jgi:hypothetical protein
MCAEIKLGRSGGVSSPKVNDCKRTKEKEVNVPISSEHLFVKFRIVCELYHVIHKFHICIVFQYVGDHNSTTESKGQVNERHT